MQWTASWCCCVTFFFFIQHSVLYAVHFLYETHKPASFSATEHNPGSGGRGQTATAAILQYPECRACHGKRTHAEVAHSSACVGLRRMGGCSRSSVNIYIHRMHSASVSVNCFFWGAGGFFAFGFLNFVSNRDEIMTAFLYYHRFPLLDFCAAQPTMLSKTRLTKVWNWVIVWCLVNAAKCEKKKCNYSLSRFQGTSGLRGERVN